MTANAKVQAFIRGVLRTRVARTMVEERFIRQDAFQFHDPHLEGIAARARALGLVMMDGAYYWDTRAPFISSDIAAVTLAATNKALYPAAAFPSLGAQYFATLGKKLRIELFGRITTGLTPGNGTLGVLWGTGADANGVSVVASAAQTLIASQTNLSWRALFDLHCRSTGATGTAFGSGVAMFPPAVIAAGASILIPASAPVVSAAIDFTAALIPSVQFLRSGSTVETMQVHDLVVAALN
jgi:hypothetical protein